MLHTHNTHRICNNYSFSASTVVSRKHLDVIHPEVFSEYWNKTCQTRRCAIRNNILHKKCYMFRLYLSHLHALKGQIHTVGKQCIVGSPKLTINRLYNYQSLCLFFNCVCSLPKYRSTPEIQTRLNGEKLKKENT
jgi:hypothetical protein